MKNAMGSVSTRRPALFLPLLLWFWLVTSALQAVVSAETIEDSRRGFSLTLPDGFHPMAEAATAPSIPYAFAYGEQDEYEIGILLFIEELGGVLTNERLTEQNMPPGFAGSLFPVEWQGLTVDGIEAPERMDGQDVVIYNVQIPLKAGGIQIRLFGPASRTPELKKLMRETLDGLHGESNWSSSSANPRASGMRMDLLAVGVLIVVGGLVVLWLVSKRTPRGTVLAIAAGIWAITFIVPRPASREMLVIIGALRLLGFVGGILGLVELLRRREKEQPLAVGLLRRCEKEQPLDAEVVTSDDAEHNLPKENEPRS